jgi:asparagine synthase (glutamine-hydrolysing)
MCGIAGIFDLRAPREIDARTLRGMTTALRHRGPDGDGFHVEPGLGLGHRRLSIIDLSGGAQPMGNEDGSVIVSFNGEIYDYQPLRRALEKEGHVFRTNSDTETIVHAWESWGVNCLTRLSGMFAFALWDRNRQQLFLARDRLGKKPLYYSVLDQHEVIFASELCGITAHPRFRPLLSLPAVDDFLAYGYVPDPGSIYSGVWQVPAAHYLLLERGQPIARPKPYWVPRFDCTTITEDEAVEELLQQLTKSVNRRLVADVPLGAFLSGGIDSGTVVAVMAGLRRDPVATFTIALDGEADESPYAAAVARRYSTAHAATQIGLDYIDAAREQAAIYGEPFADSSSVPTYQVSRLARSRVTVALSGDGGDELFAGYRRYQWHVLTESVRRVLPGSVRRQAIGTLAKVYPKLDRAPRWLRAKTTLTEISLDSALGYYRTMAKVADEQRRQLLSSDLRYKLDGYDPAGRIGQLISDSGSDEPLCQAQYVDLKTWLIGDILTKVDRASMANSLEVRVPLLDHEFVSWAMSLPRSFLLRNGQRKYLLRRAAARLLPGHVIDRPKQGFAQPLKEQFRGTGAVRLRRHLLGDAMADSNYFDLATISRWIDEHDRGAFDRSAGLWSLLVFEGFLSKHQGQVHLH